MYMGIGNLKVMNESFKKLVDLCLPAKLALGGSAPTTEAFHSALEASHWIENIRYDSSAISALKAFFSVILSSAVIVATMVHSRGISCVTHCTDGWDRTPQLSALAQLLLDPFYRTTIGFQILIEKVRFCSSIADLLLRTGMD